MSSPTIEIRRATRDDLDDILPLMAAFNANEDIVWRPESMVPALRRLLGESSLGMSLVAHDRATGEIAGYGLATFGYDVEFAGPDAFITELFVDEAFRRLGVGQDLLDALIDQLTERGTHAVHLMVRPENERARALYQGRGFKDIPRLLMTKSLGNRE